MNVCFDFFFQFRAALQLNQLWSSLTIYVLPVRGNLRHHPNLENKLGQTKKKEKTETGISENRRLKSRDFNPHVSIHAINFKFCGQSNNKHSQIKKDKVNFMALKLGEGSKEATLNKHSLPIRKP